MNGNRWYRNQWSCFMGVKCYSTNIQRTSLAQIRRIRWYCGKYDNAVFSTFIFYNPLQSFNKAIKWPSMYCNIVFVFFRYVIKGIDKYKKQYEKINTIIIFPQNKQYIINNKIWNCIFNYVYRIIHVMCFFFWAN